MTKLIKFSKLDSYQAEALLWLELNWCDDEKPMCIPTLQVHNNCHRPLKSVLCTVDCVFCTLYCGVCIVALQVGRELPSS